jgi:hypothetical protein
MNFHHELHKLETLAIKHAEAIRSVREMIDEECPQWQIDAENMVSCAIGSLRNECREHVADMLRGSEGE